VKMDSSMNMETKTKNHHMETLLATCYIHCGAHNSDIGTSMKKIVATSAQAYCGFLFHGYEHVIFSITTFGA